VEHLLEMNFMLRLFHDRIAHLDLTLADDAAGDRDSLFRRMVSDVVGALVLVSSAVVLVSASRVLVTLLTEVGVGSASELGQIAAEVALELDVAQAVLLAHVLLTNSHVRQPAALAHELFSAIPSSWASCSSAKFSSWQST